MSADAVAQVRELTSEEIDLTSGGQTNVYSFEGGFSIQWGDKGYENGIWFGAGGQLAWWTGAGGPNPKGGVVPL